MKYEEFMGRLIASQTAHDLLDAQIRDIQTEMREMLDKEENFSEEGYERLGAELQGLCMEAIQIEDQRMDLLRERFRKE